MNAAAAALFEQSTGQVICNHASLHSFAGRVEYGVPWAFCSSILTCSKRSQNLPHMRRCKLLLGLEELLQAICSEVRASGNFFKRRTCALEDLWQGSGTPSWACHSTSTFNKKVQVTHVWQYCFKTRQQACNTAMLHDFALCMHGHDLFNLGIQGCATELTKEMIKKGRLHLVLPKSVLPWSFEGASEQL